MKKKYSTREENILLSSQLYQLDRIGHQNFAFIEALGDLLPGVVLINDMVGMENIYINNIGCTFFDRSREEIHQLGADYFSLDSFCEKELAWISKHFSALALRNDHDETTGFYQKVRRNKKADWKQYYLSGKILKGSAGKFIYMGIEVDQRKKSIHSLNDQINIAPIKPVTFQRFCSLSKREKEILKLLANGLTNQCISNQLFIALYTVKTHRKNINQKLGTKSLTDLIRISDLFNIL